MARIADSLTAPLLMLRGLILMVTPLALWVAWTDAIFLVVLATGATAGVLYCALAGLENPSIRRKPNPSTMVDSRMFPTNSSKKYKGSIRSSTTTDRPGAASSVQPWSI